MKTPEYQEGPELAEKYIEHVIIQCEKDALEEVANDSVILQNYLFFNTLHHEPTPQEGERNNV